MANIVFDPSKRYTAVLADGRGVLALRAGDQWELYTGADFDVLVGTGSDRVELESRYGVLSEIEEREIA